MKPEVETKVSEALIQFWIPIVDAFTLDEIDIDNNDDRRKMSEEYPHIDDAHWDNLVDDIKTNIGDIAIDDYKSNHIWISLSNVKGFGIEIARESSEDNDKYTGFDAYELEDMSNDEALEYLEELNELQEASFEYSTISIYAPNRSIHVILDYEGFITKIGSITNGLIKTPEIYNEAVKNASIDLQHEAERQREIDDKIKAKQEERKRILEDFSAKVEPYLLEAGWRGKYRVSLNFDNFVLSLQVRDYDECRYEGASQSDVIAKVGELVNFANAFLSLKITYGCPILHGNQVRTADWQEINK